MQEGNACYENSPDGDAAKSRESLNEYSRITWYAMDDAEAFARPVGTFHRRG